MIISEFAGDIGWITYHGIKLMDYLGDTMFKVKYGALSLSFLLPCSSIAAPLCDVTFINPPTFVTLCENSTVTATYTIQNNKPATVAINYIRLQNNDAFPTSSAAIVTAPTNNCGSSLAAGASCEISVQILSTTTLGTFDRILQVGINSRQVEIDAPVITVAADSTCTTPPPTPLGGFASTIAGTPSSLYNFSILGSSTVTNTGLSVVSGDVDLTPGSSVTGFPPGIIVNDSQHINDATATAVKTAAQNYFTALNLLACNNTYGAGTDISSLSPLDCTASPVKDGGAF